MNPVNPISVTDYPDASENPYPIRSPEFNLLRSAQVAEKLAETYTEQAKREPDEAERYAQLAASQTERAQQFRAALAKIVAADTDDTTRAHVSPPQPPLSEYIHPAHCEPDDEDEPPSEWGAITFLLSVAAICLIAFALLYFGAISKARAQATSAIVSGTTYRVSYTISGSYTSSDARHRFRIRGTGGNAFCPVETGDGVHVCYIVGPPGAYSLEVVPAYGFAGVLDDVSVREVVP